MGAEEGEFDERELLKGGSGLGGVEIGTEEGEVERMEEDGLGLLLLLLLLLLLREEGILDENAADKKGREEEMN